MHGLPAKKNNNNNRGNEAWQHWQCSTAPQNSRTITEEVPFFPPSAKNDMFDSVCPSPQLMSLINKTLVAFGEVTIASPKHKLSDKIYFRPLLSTVRRR
jgi:hypothetical protein